jgi:hypothetical protein
MHVEEALFKADQILNDERTNPTSKEAIEKAQMLFGEEVIDYMEVTDKAARGLYVVVKKMAKDPADMQAIDDQYRLMNQLTITLREQRVEIFRPYLALFHRAVAQA